MPSSSWTPLPTQVARELSAEQTCDVVALDEAMPPTGTHSQEGCAAKAVSVKTAVLGAVVAAMVAVVVTLTVTTQPESVPTAGLERPETVLNFVLNTTEMEALKGEALFKELSPKEVREVARWATSALGCSTRYESIAKCFLSGSESVSLKQPAKADALAYLDNTGYNGAPPPPRMAQVLVVHGDKSTEAGVGIYEVGPLDGNGGLTPNASINLMQSEHFNRRPLDMSDGSVGIAVDKTLKTFKHLLLDSFGPIWPQFPHDYFPETAGSISWLSGANVFSSLHHRSSRIWFNWYKHPDEFQINWLHTLPFSFDVLHVGTPVDGSPGEDDEVENITYCGQMFNKPDDLLLAMEAESVTLCKDIERTAYAWDVPGPNPGTETKPPMNPGDARPDKGETDATTVNARRTETDPTIPKTWQITPGGSVRWKDWEFIATLRPGTGISLHDVRYRKDRILYELALSEAQAFYSGPDQRKQFHYSDKAYSLLQLSGDMVEGLDCPKGASFIDGTVWIYSWKNSSFTYDPGQAKAMKLACVFESDGFHGSGWRHTQMLNRHTTGRPFKQLVVRAVGTVGNYDYITEIRFGEDGHVHVGEDFAGYPEVDRLFHRTDARSLAFDGVPNWGSIVQTKDREDQDGDNVQLLHSHFALFKVDLDVLGTRNEFHVTTSEISNDPDDRIDGVNYGWPKKIQKTRRVLNESAAIKYVANPAKPGVWRFLNPEKINARTGTPRGYAIQIGSAPAVQTLPDDHPFSLAGSFAKRHLAVTQRHDEEPTGVHNLDFYALPDPLYGIDKFLSDEESLIKEDLVCWVSVGKDHIARSEDQPLVSNFGVYFTILPWDYHEENPAMQLPMIGKGPAEEVGGLGTEEELGGLGSKEVGVP
jgi:hypothetical protein